MSVMARALLHRYCWLAANDASPEPTHHYKENTMSEHVYKQIELTGSSPQSSDDAVRVALSKASKTLRNMHWFEVVETRGHIEDGKILHWQVTIKVGLRIDD
jgi:flavin-binding protein dodecin